ncbi:MAG TPA: carboxypeptidase-like regulatory domain-containing protein, partial [Terriglobia bacterium]|nr:carboxypeptidase-like regulatory domain-containing protein [Terriglobia bacterium]
MKGIGVIAILALLQQPPTPAVPASQTEKIKDGTITVNVFDSVTHNPIVGARVTFIYFQSPPPNIVTSVNSDANGQAIFKDLNEGRYGIGADKDGYVSTPTAAVTNTVELRAEKRKTDVTVNLVPGALITGRVLDPDGLPVAKATVSLSRLTYRNGLPTLPPVAGSGVSNTTDDRGEFRISGTAPGNYYLRVELHLIDCRTCVSWDLLPRTSYYPGVVDSRAGVPIAVSTGQNILSLDVKLPKVETYTISGTVLNPLEGGLVFAGRQSREISSYFLGSSDPDALE